MSTSATDGHHKRASPTTSDLQLGRLLAQKIVNAGRGRVRRVVMIGSRAGGYARPGSDLDLVVIVELPPDTKPWNGSDADAERDRIQREVGPPPISTDMTVRSAAQFEEAKGIIGGVERLVETEGVDLYSEPFTRPARARRTRDEVRFAIVRAWIEASATAIANGVVVELDSSRPVRSEAVFATVAETPNHEGVLRFVVRPKAAAPAKSVYWSRSIRQAITALEVLYQIEAAKHDRREDVLDELAKFSPAAVSTIRQCLNASPDDLDKARAVLNAVMDSLPRPLQRSAWFATVRRQISAPR